MKPSLDHTGLWKDNVVSSIKKNKKNYVLVIVYLKLEQKLQLQIFLHPNKKLKN
jgi:hypothetical protein